MAKSVDLVRLADVLPDYRFAILVTVGEDFRVRTTTITPRFDGAVLDIGPVGPHGSANLSTRTTVTVIWPGLDAHDYSLIVDGHATLPDDPGAAVLVTPTKALLHRPVFDADSGRALGTVHDCVPLMRD